MLDNFFSVLYNVLVQRLVHANLYFKRKWLAPTNYCRGGKIALMPIAMAKPGETVIIRKITGKDEVRQHLAELGFVVDTKVTVVSEIAGSLILQVKESRIALDKSMANRILI